MSDVLTEDEADICRPFRGSERFAAESSLVRIIDRLVAAVAAMERERDQYRDALKKHLCPNDMADWVACCGDHGGGCSVCDNERLERENAAFKRRWQWERRRAEKVLEEREAETAWRFDAERERDEARRELASLRAMRERLRDEDLLWKQYDDEMNFQPYAYRRAVLGEEG